MQEPVRVLYVDSRPIDREMVRKALEKEPGNFRVLQARSHAELEARLKAGGFDLVLTDFNILGLPGLQIIDAVWREFPEVPVILVTGRGSEEVAVEATKHGVADYVIKKPSHLRRLPQTIRSVLEKAQIQKEPKRTREALRESEAKFLLVSFVTRLLSVYIPWQGNCTW